MSHSLDPDPLWSERHGRAPIAAFDHAGVRRTFAAIVSEYQARGWFQEYFGYDCVDKGFVAGKLGGDIEGALLIETGRSNIWPVPVKAASWDDDTLFDMVEFLYRCVSAGIEESGRYHEFAGCGWHFSHFNNEEGQRDYRRTVNRLLERYEGGFDLSNIGRVERRLPLQVAELMASPLVGVSPEEIHIAEAVRKYQSRVGLDRRDAVRDLADVLESMRSLVREHMFTRDQQALFQIANQFWIRHNDPDQRRDYDHDAWWDWLFHLYLSSIRLVQRLTSDSTQRQL